MGYNVTINRQGLSALFDLKGKKGAMSDHAGGILPVFPDQHNTYTQSAGSTLFHIGRNHWILRGDISAEDTLISTLKPDQAPSDVSIVQVSDTLTFFSVVGADAAQVMSIACPLDLHSSVFGADAVTYTEVFGLKALVLRQEGGFEFAVEQSFGDLIQDYLDRAIA
ncbi:aminomethyltransferase family protein [Cochlodiniinecator piscidefendens]|uniref:sarcosine oxidase subunit gamma n=1 Tax=Cochlodiniinecator piscidefendens TaxID=2715756 RepID=UPI00140B2B05|nr:sarcosine oxidase subunit gamma [Cochlodiniinecator piscidefendens]